MSLLFQPILLTLFIRLLSAGSSPYVWSIGNLKLKCDLPSSEGVSWFPGGDSCLFVNETKKFAFEESALFCSSEIGVNAKSLSNSLDNWLMVGSLGNIKQGVYWTGFRTLGNESIHDMGLVNMETVYNPMWAASQPHYSNEGWCLALSITTDVVKAGWVLRNCSEELPVICQTFACKQGEFRCRDNSRCIPERARHDQIRDCEDNSDEEDKGLPAKAIVPNLVVYGCSLPVFDTWFPTSEISLHDGANISVECQPGYYSEHGLSFVSYCQHSQWIPPLNCPYDSVCQEPPKVVHNATAIDWSAGNKTRGTVVYYKYEIEVPYPPFMICDFASNEMDWIKSSNFDIETQKAFCYSAELASAKYAEVPAQVSYGNDISIPCMKGSINPSFDASCLPSGEWEQDIFTACENNTKYPPWACDGGHLAGENGCEYPEYGTTFVKCDEGYRPKNYTCQDIDECHEGTALCSGGFQCINTDGSYYCDCSPGFEKQMLSVDYEGQNITVTECLAEKCATTFGYCTPGSSSCVYSKPHLQFTTNDTTTLLSTPLALNSPLKYWASAELKCSEKEFHIETGLAAEEVFCTTEQYPQLNFPEEGIANFMQEIPVSCTNFEENIVGSEWTYCKPNYKDGLVEGGILHNPPICFAKSCGNPMTYINATGLIMVAEYHWPDYYIGYLMSFSCADECFLVGSESTACEDESGVPQWVPSLPTCICGSTSPTVPSTTAEPVTTIPSLLSTIPSVLTTLPSVLSTNSQPGFGSALLYSPRFPQLEASICDPNLCPNGDCTFMYPNGTAECNCKEGSVLVAGICTLQYPTTPCDPDGSANWTRTSYPNADGFCNCNPGYTGRFCNVISECELEGGVINCNETCFHLLINAGEENPRIEGKCLCPQNRGMDCSEPVFNPCDEWTCEHGVCSYNKTEETECACQPGYFGEHCASSISPCSEKIEGNTHICENGGICMPSELEGAICECVPGFTGKLCESVINNCEKENCSGHGECWFYFESFFCDCLPGYYGERCEYAFDECSTRNPCQHNATCHIQSNGRALCECAVGFTGRFCESLIETCNVTMCNNHAKACKSGYDGHPICFCEGGWYGQTCDKHINYCDFDPCFNGATCHGTVDNYTCLCTPGWSGAQCATPHGCLDEIGCYGHGECKFNETCICDKHFIGRRCENDYTEACGILVHCLNGGTCTDKRIDEVSGIVKYIGFCTCGDFYEGARCESSRTRDFNLQFSGRFRNTQNFASKFVAVGSSFTICGWVQISNSEDVLFLSIKDRAGHKLVEVSNSAIIIDSNSIPIGLNDFLWHQFCFRFSNQLFVHLDGVFIANAPYPFPALNSDVQVTLVPYHNAQFMGSISGVQVYSAPLSDDDISEMSFNCNYYSPPDPILSWIDFPKIALSNWAVSPVFPGICYGSQHLPGRIPAPGAPDKILPIVTYCPKIIQKISSKRLTSVEWKTEFTDNIEVTRIDANFISGDTFTWGIYEVVTTAYDAADNFASCVFNIIISPSTCPSITQPDNAKYNIFYVDSLFASEAATLTCNDTQYTDENLPIFATCDIMGQWSRVSIQPPGKETSLPDCGRTVNPIQSGNGSVTMSGDCPHARKKLDAALGDVFRPLCPDNFTEFCTFTLSDCPKQLMLKEEEGFTFTFEFVVNSVRYSVNSNVSSELSKSNDTSNYSLSTPKFFCSKEQPVLITTATSVFCTTCNETYGLDANGKCELCRDNQYSSSTDNECHNCPNGQTCGDRPGVKKDDCFLICDPGQHSVYLNASYTQCEECGKGTYSVYGGVLQCTSCPSDKTTTHTGSTSPDDCVSCPAGTQMSEDEKCEPCPIGTFSNAARCDLCKYGLTTSHDGSTSEKECDVINCPINTFTVAGAGPVDVDTFQLDRYCRKCEIGTYTVTTNASECIKCTSPSDSPTQCNVNLCSDNSCPTGQVCTKTDLGTRCFAKEVSEKHNSSPLKWIAVAAGVVFLFVLCFGSIIMYFNRNRIKIVLGLASKQEALVSTEYRRPASAATPHLMLEPSNSEIGTYSESFSTRGGQNRTQILNTRPTLTVEPIPSNLPQYPSATLRSPQLVNRRSSYGEDDEDKFSQNNGVFRQSTLVVDAQRRQMHLPPRIRTRMDSELDSPWNGSNGRLSTDETSVEDDDEDFFS